MKRAWRAIALGSALGIALAAAPLLAAGGDPDDAIEIEQYHGLKRTDAYSVTPPASAKPKIPAAPEQGTVIAIDPKGPAQLVPCVERAPLVDCGIAKGCVDSSRAGSARVAPELPDIGIKYSASPGDKTSDIPAPTPIAKAEAPAPVAAREAPVVVVNPPAPQVVNTSTVDESLMNAASQLIGAILTPLAILASVWIVVRYLQGRSGPLIRIEHVGGSFVAAAMPSASDAEPQLNSDGFETPATVPPQPAEPVSTAESFEIGPTYEDERLAREEQTLRQEEGVLRQLFDDNIKMRQELKSLHADWSAEASSEIPAETPPSKETATPAAVVDEAGFASTELTQADL